MARHTNHNAASVDADELRFTIFKFRVTASDLRNLKIGAALLGTSVSGLVREAATEKAGEVISRVYGCDNEGTK